jgi:hypothetical protein
MPQVLGQSRGYSFDHCTILAEKPSHPRRSLIPEASTHAFMTMHQDLVVTDLADLGLLREILASSLFGLRR